MKKIITVTLTIGTVILIVALSSGCVSLFGGSSSNTPKPDFYKFTSVMRDADFETALRDEGLIGSVNEYLFNEFAPDTLYTRISKGLSGWNLHAVDDPQYMYEHDRSQFPLVFKNNSIVVTDFTYDSGGLFDPTNFLVSELFEIPFQYIDHVTVYKETNTQEGKIIWIELKEEHSDVIGVSPRSGGVAYHIYNFGKGEDSQNMNVLRSLLPGVRIEYKEKWD